MAICFCLIRQNSLAFFITILTGFSREFICLVRVFFASYSLFKQYQKLLIWGFSPQWPGVLICNRVRTESPYQPYLLRALLCLRLSKLELELIPGFIFQDSALSSKFWVSGCKLKLLSCKPKCLMGRISEDENVVSWSGHCRGSEQIHAHWAVVAVHGHALCAEIHIPQWKKDGLGFPCVCWRCRVYQWWPTMAWLWSWINSWHLKLWRRGILSFGFIAIFVVCLFVFIYF